VTDARLKEYSSLEGVTMDLLLLDSGRLDEREELATAVRVALGTDATAGANDVLPDPDSTDRRGWWGDFEAAEIWGGWPIGCKNWLLMRAKITDAPAVEGSTLQRARQYTMDALRPFVEIRAASNANAIAVRTGVERIEVTAQLFRGPELEIDLNYQQLWQEEPVFDPPAVPVSGSGSKQIRIPYRDLVFSTTAPQLQIVPRTATLEITTTAPYVIRS
jgi:phage gp46-like protein